MAHARLAFQLGYGTPTVLVWAASFYSAGLFDERRVHEADGCNSWHRLLPRRLWLCRRWGSSVWL